MLYLADFLSTLYSIQLTTLNIYAHITDNMKKQAAQKIDKGITGNDAAEPAAPAKAPLPPSEFTPIKGKYRKPGTGCISRINDHLWEGRYSPVWPDGKKHPRNIYAHREEECEKLLAEMIVEEKAKIASEKERLKTSA